MEVDGGNPLAKIGFIATLLYVFGIVSLFEEITISSFGFKPYLTSWTVVVAMIAALFSGRFSRLLHFRPAMLLSLFTLWLAICVPFSTWAGGSLEGVLSYITKSLIIMFLLVTTATTWRQLRLVFYAMTGAAALIALAARPLMAQLNSSEDVRLTFLEGRLANPNDLATHMIVLLPFILGLFLVTSRISLTRIIALVVAGATFYTVLLTASRGAFVTLLLLGFVLFLNLPTAAQKVGMMIAAIAIVLTAAAVLPPAITRRYLLVFTSADTAPEDVMESRSLASSEARREILKRSLIMTLQNPIFGVGPGTFAIAEAGEAREEGKRGAWLQTHNSYTQVSSESGLPGFLLFVSVIVSALRTAFRYNRTLRAIPGFDQQARAAMVLFYSILGFAINICFSSLAYSFYIPMLIGMLGAFSVIIENDLTARRQARAA